MLKEDEVMFVKKSVANHLTGWLKVNKEPTIELIIKWRDSNNSIQDGSLEEQPGPLMLIDRLW